MWWSWTSPTTPRPFSRRSQKYRKGTPFEPEEPDQDLCPKLYAEILAAGVFTQKDAADFAKLLASGTDAQVQFFGQCAADAVSGYDHR